MPSNLAIRSFDNSRNPSKADCFPNACQSVTLVEAGKVVCAQADRSIIIAPIINTLIITPYFSDLSFSNVFRNVFKSRQRSYDGYLSIVHTL
ncbi:hypothetical protein BA746_26000 [Vibrio parahaemolyticus]|nr:hypothetical protein BA746_26000 [Vibrio parahaemolyticus]